LVSTTLLDDPVMRVLAAWKMKTASGLSFPLSVTVPVSPMAPGHAPRNGARTVGCGGLRINLC
jgi:hypothetical protein